MAEDKNILYVDLYDNPLTAKGGDYSGKVACTGSVQNTTVGQLIARKRSEYRPETIANILDLSDQEKLEALAAGKTVNTGLGTLMLNIEGVFDGEKAPFEAGKHKIGVSFTPGKALRDALAALQIQTRPASTGIVINNVEDGETKEQNGQITSGGVLVINGVNLKVAGEDESVGVHLTKVSGGPAVAARAIIHNNPSQLTVMLPTLEDGEYTLSVTTQSAAGNRLLRAPRTATLPVPLYVGEKPAGPGEEQERPGGL